MATPDLHDLLASIRNLPIGDRLRLIEQAARDVAEDTPNPPAAGQGAAPSLVGLMADVPELVDEVCSFAYQARNAARMRTIDE